MLQGKRGLSDIVTNVLIILLVLVAVGIVWFFVQPFIRDSVSGISVDPYTVSLGVRANSVTASGGVVSAVVQRGAGKGNIVGFNIIITDSSGVNKVVRNDTELGEFETVMISVDYVALGLASIKSVSVVPILVDGSGKEINGQQSSPVAPVGALTQVCTPNDLQACTTLGVVGPGNRTCNAFGTGWGPCYCVNSATQACTPIGGGPGISTCTNQAWGSCTGTGTCTSGNTQACAVGGFNGTQTCVAQSWGSCTCNNGNIACVTGGGYAGTQTCNAGVIGSCQSSLSCGDGIVNGPETCELNGGAGFYGPSCTTNLGSLPGNQTCTAGTCQLNNNCFCFMDFDYPSIGNPADGYIDWNDFGTWGYAFSQGDMLADCNHDGVLNAADGDGSDFSNSLPNSCIGRLFDALNNGVTLCN